MLHQLERLVALPQDVKNDSISGPTVNQTELVRIARLSADKQPEGYWNTKRRRGYLFWKKL
jgi:hypothetical protein